MKTYFISGNIVDASWMNKTTSIQNADSSIYYDSSNRVGSVTEYIDENKPYGGTSGGGIFATEILTSISYYGGGNVKSTIEGRSSESKTITTNIYYDGGGTVVDNFNNAGSWIATGDGETAYNDITTVWKTGSSIALGKVSGTTVDFAYTGSVAVNFLGSDNTANVFLNIQNASTRDMLDYKASGGFMLWIIGSELVGSNGYYLGGRDTLYPGWNFCWAGSLVDSPDLTTGSFQLSGGDLHTIQFAFKTTDAGSLITSGNLLLDRFIQRNFNSQTGDIAKIEVSVA